MATYAGTSLADTLTGGIAKVNDSLNGGLGNDLYRWSIGAGNDVITDTGGSDRFELSDPNNLFTSWNVYRATSTNNLVFDFAAQGKVTVINQYVGANRIENLTFSDGWGPFALSASGTGTTGSDLLVGTVAAQTLNGLAGDDLIFGYQGNDTIYGGAGDDEIVAGSGNNRIYGEAGSDDLFGGAGADTINGGGDSDTASYLDQSQGVIINFSGVSKTSGLITLANSTVYEKSGATRDTLIAVETVEGTRYADVFYGGRMDLPNSGTGGGKFIGGAGNDTFYGGGANTWMHVSHWESNTGIVINLSSTSITVGGVNVASMTGRDGLGGIDTYRLSSGYINISGSDLNDYIRGRSDVRNGWLSGGKGNDTIIGGSADDTAGFDTDGTYGVIVNLSSATFMGVASNRARDEYGNTDTLSSIESVAGTGKNDYIMGSSANNQYLSGRDGNDNIYGGAGSDYIYGDNGNDRLIGGTGRDYLNGGAGKDIFDYDSFAEIGSGSTTDMINNFVSGDRIDLSTIAAPTTNGAFIFSDTSLVEGSATGKVAYSNGWISISTDADSAAEYQIQLVGTVPATLAATDFIL